MFAGRCRILASVTFLVVAGNWALTGSLKAQDLLRGHTCAQVRDAVVKFGGPENAAVMARANGGTEAEIGAARKCLVQQKQVRVQQKQVRPSRKGVPS
jgi:hypothetical protein